jgi:hypothetical protein
VFLVVLFLAMLLPTAPDYPLVAGVADALPHVSLSPVLAPRSFDRLSLPNACSLFGAD